MILIRGVFFFSSRRRHTRYWRDWSSDVCSSDLYAAAGGTSEPLGVGVVASPVRTDYPVSAVTSAGCSVAAPRAAARDRESVVEGKSVDLGGGRIIQKKK